MLRLFSRINSIYQPLAKVSRFLAVLALSGVAYGLYRGVLENYLAVIIRFSPFERGIMEFFRELPGFLVAFILVWMYRISENTIFKISLFLMTLGIAGLLIGTGKIMVVAFVVLASFGEHIILPFRSTITLSMAKKETGGTALGITSATEQLGNIAGYAMAALIFFIFTRMGFERDAVPRFKAVFLISTILMVISVLTALAIKGGPVKTKRRKLYFAKKVRKYYILEMFFGARKQVFRTFAPYVLILQYGADVSILTLLFTVSMGACVVFNPVIGRVIDKLGYKFVMMVNALPMIIVCFFYGFSHRLFPSHIAYIVVCVNYVLDTITSMLGMANKVYVKSVAANQDEITDTLYTGVSVSHVISIFIALMGGWIWKMTGIEVLFSLSAFFSLLNSIYATTIPATTCRGGVTGND